MIRRLLDHRATTALLLSVAVVCTAESVRAQAPPGFTTTEDEAAGWRFYCPRSYTPLPVPPGEPVVLARFIRRLRERSSKALTRSVAAPEIWILALPRAQPEPAVTGQVSPPPEKDPESDGPRSAREALRRRLAVTGFDGFIAKRLTKAKVTAQETGGRGDRIWRRYELEYGPSTQTLRFGVAWVYEDADRELALLASAPAAEFRRHLKTFTRAGLSLRPIATQGTQTRALAKTYERHPDFREPELRMARRAELVGGWKAVDTPSYLILYHTTDKKLLGKIQHDLEALRRYYARLYPAAEGFDRIGVVRVCRDRKEYLFYGGSGRSAGYWNNATEELVLYDNVAGREGSRFGNRDSTIVLYHEAFHQYIQYATGGAAPHYWFNEGNADYFSGSKVYTNTNNIKEVALNPWRLGAIKKALEAKATTPLKRFVAYDRSKYYNPSRMSLNYAEGWSFIYFLRQSQAASSNSIWSNILPAYYRTLRDVYLDELARLGENPALKQMNEAGKKAREKALAKAFEGVDFEALETAWRKFVSRLR